jgi:O-antigen ligase
VLAGLFLLFYLIAAVATDVSYNAFIGETQRKLGFTTYLFFITYLIGAMIIVKNSDTKFFYYVILIVSFCSGVYSMLQHFGYDFINWNNPYNPIISTLGNPNFASSSMALFGTLLFSSLFNGALSLTYKIFAASNLLNLVFAIYFSKSIQGLVGLFIGFSIFVCLLTLTRARVIGILFSVLTVTIGCLTILAMFKIGPLTDLIYKNSISIRGYYWRAGLRMFADNPLFGVGIDRFAAYFKEYREPSYVLNYGNEITSSNAHNVFIQMLATGGMFVGFIFLCLMFWITMFGLRNSLKLVNSETNFERKFFYFGLYAAWSVYLSQNIISIENIGLSIWGWILGGMIIGLRFQIIPVENSNVRLTVVSKGSSISKTKATNRALKSTVLSSAFVLISVITVSVLYRGEVESIKTRNYFNYEQPENSPGFLQAAQNYFDIPLAEPFYKFKIAEALIVAGSAKEGLIEYDKLLKEDQRNQDYLLSLAAYYQSKNQCQESIDIRQKVYLLDPWNSLNLLDMGICYKYIGDFTEMENIKRLILSYAGNTREGTIAIKELSK